LGFEFTVIDLHCHILPGIDDGASDLRTALAMAEASVADGVQVLACTPHILPGVYHNTGPQIRAAVRQLQEQLDAHEIPLRLVAGADVHIVPDFVAGLRSGHLLTLADSRYVLVEPPHHVAPPRLKDLMFQLLVADYVPILTHPERLTWINAQYADIVEMGRAGVWMQITAGAIVGDFGKMAKYWAERMLDEGLVHIIATDAHDTQRRPPALSRGRDAAAVRVGEQEAEHLVVSRPLGIVQNQLPSTLPRPLSGSPSAATDGISAGSSKGATGGYASDNVRPIADDAGAARRGGVAEWLRQFFDK
jgi:protein-tyrosine phosphatase